jgi:hypothetical protein
MLRTTRRSPLARDASSSERDDALAVVLSDDIFSDSFD